MSYEKLFHFRLYFCNITITNISLHFREFVWRAYCYWAYHSDFASLKYVISFYFSCIEYLWYHQLWNSFDYCCAKCELSDSILAQGWLMRYANITTAFQYPWSMKWADSLALLPLFDITLFKNAVKRLSAANFRPFN